ncbi:MAG TPA: 50S ribosomal protein L9 [Phycisphaerales bacterium]|nr:50S ribosomal protein L9 [Phycisphaerales bacterium]
MKVLLRKNVSKLGKIGEVVNVKPGYARNYLLPQGLATEPTEANVKRVEAEKAAYLEQLAKERAQLQAKAQLVDGKEITISARANEEGHLYGSVGPAQIAAVLAEAGAFVEPETVQLREPIRQLDKYDVTLDFGEEVTATIHVWIVPIREPGEEAPAEEAQEPETSADEDTQ